MSYKTLFQKTYDLVRWIYPTVSKFPRSQRTVLSERIELISLRLLEMVIDFSEKDTKDYRKKILNEVHKLQILLRLCKDLSFLKFKQYEYASSLLAGISGILDYRDSKSKTEDSKLGEIGSVGGGVAQKMVLSAGFRILGYGSTSFSLQESVQGA
ncbi:MAG: four helix bundle protein, partial [Candidatus Aenigmarchaeota archaeon]|nr:four helix bundle protein [Candidatus Aenigmarchaeota archaeon]